MRQNNKLAIIILAAGKSSRMKSSTSKVLHNVAGWSVLRHVIETATALNPERIILVTSPDAQAILAEGKKYAPNLEHAVQEIANGTGGAVISALPSLTGFTGDVIILYGDSPLIKPATLAELLAKTKDDAMAITTMQPANPAQYGRIILSENGYVREIIEYNDASDEVRQIGLCNAGFIAIRAALLHDLAGKIQNNNARCEYYLTDLVSLANAAGNNCAYIEVSETETLGINDKRELAQAEAIMQARLREKHLQNGVAMLDPNTVYFSMDTIIGDDVLIQPFVIFAGGVKIEDSVEVKSFSHIEGAKLGNYTSVGPFARIRVGSELCDGVAVGNFVEIKNSKLARGVKAGHLSYIGDTQIGENTNVGAGTITCNYDGRNKHKTIIGSNVFIGSDTALIAPVRVGDNVTIAAGSVITEDIADNSLAIARSRQVNKNNWK